MFQAIVRTGGKQFLVEKGQTIRVPLIKTEPGQSIELEALLTSGENGSVGSPLVEETKVTAKVIDHGRGPKMIVFKKKRRKQYKRKHGHRQDYTTLLIDSIS